MAKIKRLGEKLPEPHYLGLEFAAAHGEQIVKDTLEIARIIAPVHQFLLLCNKYDETQYLPMGSVKTAAEVERVNEILQGDFTSVVMSCPYHGEITGRPENKNSNQILNGLLWFNSNQLAFSEIPGVIVNLPAEGNPTIALGFEDGMSICTTNNPLDYHATNTDGDIEEAIRRGQQRIDAANKVLMGLLSAPTFNGVPSQSNVRKQFNGPGFEMIKKALEPLLPSREYEEFEAKKAIYHQRKRAMNQEPE